MRITKITTAAVLALATGFSAAQAASPSVDQLAATLGVNADSFTVIQLNQLSEAVRENDLQAIAFIKAQAANGNKAATVGASTSTAPGAAQLALTLGVEPGNYTIAEMAQLSQARKEDNVEAIAYILSGANREIRGGVGEVSPGKAQLAALLGVDAANYTAVELAQLSAAQSSDYD